MYLHEIETDSKAFIDANIFVYHFSEGSGFNKSCADFLYRIERSELHGITSTLVIMEAIHRLMMVEASAHLTIEVKNLPAYLKQHPEAVKQLTKHMVVPHKISGLNIEIFEIKQRIIEQSQDMKKEYGFLSNDAITLQIMKNLGINIIASNDSDFNRVEWLNLYLPVSDR